MWKSFPFRSGIESPQTRRFLMGIILLLAFLSGKKAISENSPNDRIEETRATLEQWVETQRVIARERRELAISREMLNERIDLFRREIESLRLKIDEAEESIAEADKKRAELLAENDRLKDSSISLEEILATLEARTRELLVRLPDPIRERIKPLSRRLPETPGETRLSLSERFQNVVGILNEVDKFNRDITLTSEVRRLPDGTSAEVTALYLGIGCAFYTGANGTIGGMGTISEEGWTWKPANEAAAEIARAIAIFNNEQVAAFVQLPVEVR